MKNRMEQFSRVMFYVCLVWSATTFILIVALWPSHMAIVAANIGLTPGMFVLIYATGPFIRRAFGRARARRAEERWMRTHSPRELLESWGYPPDVAQAVCEEHEKTLQEGKNAENL